ncbi:metalloendopeptidase [Malassezia brasiliensis]|uniref:Metalloendopeptidase n=1 Tax=Malassezia brasiliensis TaxID=1821822 RepID=A0AAF0DZE4_9BASI|nr:metalloendopeptidase [Malassezia brasiliensis]
MLRQAARRSARGGAARAFAPPGRTPPTLRGTACLTTTPRRARGDDRRRRTEQEQLLIDLLRQGARDLQRARAARAAPPPSETYRSTPPYAYGHAPHQAPPSQLTPRQQQLTIVLVLAGAGGVYYICHLQQVPETGRWRFLDVSITDEDKLGRQSYEQTMQTYGNRVLSSWSPDAVRVRKVAQRILDVCGDLDRARAPGAPPTQWNIHVIASPEKNAFALPGGSIFVFTGILPVCQNDDGLATVLSHEIAHVLARHPAEKMSGFTVVYALGLLMDMLGFDIGLSRMALNLLMSLPNSRAMESEADHIGLNIMAKACFDPSQAIAFWQRMGGGTARQGKLAESAQSLLSTHPVDSKRVQQIQQWLPSAEQAYDGSGCAQRSAFAGTAASLTGSTPFSMPRTRAAPAP